MSSFASSVLLALCTAAWPLAAQTMPATTHRPATAGSEHHPVMHCALPEPTLSPKIPAIPAKLGCPKMEYALTYIDTKIGTGELVQPRKWVTVQYTGYLVNGTKFDSSYDHGQPFTFPYGAHRMIPGWDTGFEGMRMGGKRRLFIPYQLAYGELGRPPVIPPKSELIFDVELLSQSDTPPAQRLPPGARPTQPGAQPGTPPPAGSGTPPPAGSQTEKPQ